MSVAKRGTYYWMIFMYNGRRIQKTTKCKNRRDAEEVERAFRTQLAKGEVGFEEKKKIPFFRDAMKEFLSWAEIENRSRKNTVRRAETSSKSLLRFFENKQIDQISVEDVERFKEWRRRQKKQAPNKKLKKNIQATTNEVIKPATANRELACLRAMLNYFIRKEVLLKNPVSRVKFFKEENEQMRVVSIEEERLYLMACSQPLQDVATIMVETGMRPSEVCQLTWKDVNFQREFVFVQQGKTKAARRKIPLSDRAYTIFSARRITAQGEFVFPGMRGDHNSHVVKLNSAHNGAVKRSKVEPFRLYDLRHTFATRAVEAGVDLVTLAALMGHTRIQMLMRYAHPTEQHQFEAIRRIEARFNKKIVEKANSMRTWRNVDI